MLRYAADLTYELFPADLPSVRSGTSVLEALVEAMKFCGKETVSGRDFVECAAACEDRAIDEYVAHHIAPASAAAGIAQVLSLEERSEGSSGLASETTTKLKHLICVQFDLLDTDRMGVHVTAASALAFSLGRLGDVAALFGKHMHTLRVVAVKH